MKIIKHGRVRSTLVEHPRRLDFSVVETMYKLMGDGLGLAAPQVGVMKRFFIVPGLLLINPRILEFSGVSLEEESCLSLPGVFVKITRARFVVLEAFSWSVEKKKIYHLQGLAARVVQHEIDHLDGKLIGS